MFWMINKKAACNRYHWLALGLSLTLLGAPVTGLEAKEGETAPIEMRKKPCKADSSWYKKPSPPLKDATFSSDFQVYRWSYHHYVYLGSTDPETRKAAFEGYEDPRRIFNSVSWSDSCKVESDERLPFMPRTKKGSSYRQPDGNILVDQNNVPVFYSVGVNKIFADYIRNKGANDLSGFNKILKQKKDRFPPGAVVVKASWRIAEIGFELELPGQQPIGPGTLIPDASSRFYTTEAKIVIPGNDCPSEQKVKLALVGLNFGAKPYTMPFLLWSSSEHQDNVPDCVESSIMRPGWSFHPIFGFCSSEGACNIPGKNQPPWRSTPICRKSPNLGATDENLQCISKLRNSSEEFYPKDPYWPWRHYQFKGALWTSHTAKEIRPDVQLGSKRLSNATLESFTQDKNCYHCHSKATPKEDCFVKDSSELFQAHIFSLLCKDVDLLNKD